jgi:hypothetical protein
MLVALVASAAYFGWQTAAGDLSPGGLALRVAVVTFVAASAGKVIGILRYRWRRKMVSRRAGARGSV